MSSTKNIHIKTKTIENKNMNIRNYSPKEIFKKYITIEEIKKHPEITLAIKGDKKFRLDILSHQKPKMINVKGVHNHNKLKFATRLNSFHKLFFNYDKNNRNSKEEIHLLNQENKDFSKKYKNSNKNNDREKFNDIKLEYEKRNYYVSPLGEKKNLFNGNILLSDKEELKNYILYDLGTPLSNCKSLSFLHKINTKLGDKTSERELKSINSKIDTISLGKDKIGKDQKIEIIKTQNDILNVKETINYMDEMNNFFNMDNKNYLELLKNEDSRKSSAKISTRVNIPLNCLEHVTYQKNKNLIKNALINNEIIQNELSLSSSKDINILNNDKIIKKKKAHINRNAYLRKFATENNNYKEKNQHKNLNKCISNSINNNNNDMLKSPLEKLYDTISKKDDLKNYQKEIKKYLKNKNYDISIKINPSSVCNNFENAREKIYKSDFMKEDIQLRKQIGEYNLTTENIKNNDLKIKNRINNIEDKMIKIFCDINNPRKKE